jgi:hypothetical protein
MGRTNHAQDPTRLLANEDGHSGGDDVGDTPEPVLDVSTGETPTMYAIHATANGNHPAIWANKLWTGIVAECEVADPNGKAIQGLAGTPGTGVTSLRPEVQAGIAQVHRVQRPVCAANKRDVVRDCWR